MDIERLRALENAVELVAKATPGPWAQEHRRGSDSSYRTEVFDEHGEAIATLTWHAKPPIYEGGMKVTSTDRAENAEAIVAAVNFIREHGSALIAELGQEVGAVADERLCDFFADVGEVEQFMDDLCNVVTELTGDEGEDDPITVLRRYIATSPAHTSEARDAGEPCQFFASGPEGSFFAKTLADAENLIDIASFDRDDWTVTDLYAAMRQEGGTP